MDPESQQLFDALVKLQPFELTGTDIEFMKSRASYLSLQEKDKFAEVLGLAEKPKAPKKAEK